MSLLALSNVTIRYGRLTAVRNVTLTSLTDSGGAVNAALSVTSAIVVAPSVAVGPSGPPPLVTTASACSIASRNTASSAASSSRTVPWSTTRRS